MTTLADENIVFYKYDSSLDPYGQVNEIVLGPGHSLIVSGNAQFNIFGYEKQDDNSLHAISKTILNESYASVVYTVPTGCSALISVLIRNNSGTVKVAASNDVLLSENLDDVMETVYNLPNLTEYPPLTLAEDDVVVVIGNGWTFGITGYEKELESGTEIPLSYSLYLGLTNSKAFYTCPIGSIAHVKVWAYNQHPDWYESHTVSILNTLVLAEAS